MKAKDLLPNTLYALNGHRNFNSPHPGTEYVFTTDDVTPSNIDRNGKEANRTTEFWIEVPDHPLGEGRGRWEYKRTPIRKYVTVYPVAWVADEFVVANTGTYEEGTQMELRHIDSGDGDSGLGTIFGRSFIRCIGGDEFPYTAPHQIVQTLEQLTENRLHLRAFDAEMDEAQGRYTDSERASNKARWEAISPDTFELLDLTEALDQPYYGHPTGRYSTHVNGVSVMLSLDQIEAINALVKESV